MSPELVTAREKQKVKDEASVATALKRANDAIEAAAYVGCGSRSKQRRT